MASALEQEQQVAAWHALMHEREFSICQNGLCELARKMGDAIRRGESGYEPSDFAAIERVWLNMARMAVLDLGRPDVMNLGKLLRTGMVLMAVGTMNTYREVAERIFAGGPSDDEWFADVVPKLIHDAERFRDTFESIAAERKGL
jgi:hypothetical protein